MTKKACFNIFFLVSKISLYFAEKYLCLGYNISEQWKCITKGAKAQKWVIVSKSHKKGKL